MEELGGRLVLPPWLEGKRAAIEASLPPLREPASATQSEMESRR
jgi:glyoxalase family protein